MGKAVEGAFYCIELTEILCVGTTVIQRCLH
jgi:hypothetical protein